VIVERVLRFDPPTAVIISVGDLNATNYRP